MTSKANSKVSSLLAAVQRVAPAAPPAATEPEPAAASERVTKKASRRTRESAQPRNKVGKPVQFWLHDEDRRLVRELAAWLAGQGIRSTDSMVIRAALRTAKTGGELLEAYRQAAQLDGRLKQHKAQQSQ